MTVRFEANVHSIAALLKLPAVGATCTDIAEAGKTRAEAKGVMVNRGADREPMPYDVVSGIVGDRQGAILIAAHPAGLAAEAKYGTLAGSV